MPILQSQRPIEIVLIEDDPNLRQLMELLFNNSKGFYCKSFAAAEPFIEQSDALSPDLVLMDIDLGLGMNGVQAVEVLHRKQPQLSIIMLTVHEDDDSIFRSLCAGASGYLVKGLEPVRLLEAVQQAATGGAPMSPKIARRVINTFHLGGQNPLSEREQQVLQLLCEGESYRGISEQLFVSGNTVRTHIKHIYEKLQVHSRAEAVAKAIRERLV
ncbi:MAG: response regulator transcription factor [Bacteroidota bacterium]